MTLADKVTSIRLVLAPVFFIIYIFTEAFWTVPVLWLLFLGSEITDLLDGIIARKRNEVTDFGKLFDPFADTLTQLTYFLCFVVDGILSPILFLLVIYREFSILLIRNLMLKKGLTIGARMGGKIKTVTYIAAAGLALLASSILRLGLSSEIYRILTIAATVVFIISVVIAVLSLFDYLSVYRKADK